MLGDRLSIPFLVEFPNKWHTIKSFRWEFSDFTYSSIAANRKDKGGTQCSHLSFSRDRSFDHAPESSFAVRASYDR
jgi:hypothetical protein